MREFDAAVDRLDQSTARLASFYRSLPESKLLRRTDDGRTAARAGYDLADLLARLGQGVEEREAEREPTWRQVPELGAFSVGDQIAVTGQDVVAALRKLRGEGEGRGEANKEGARQSERQADAGAGVQSGVQAGVWCGGRRVTAEALAERAVRESERLRGLIGC